MGFVRAVWEYLTAVFRPVKGDIPALNGIRAIAIFMLFYVHFYRPIRDAGLLSEENVYLRNFLDNGSQSIDMFFVLSGFLISRPLLNEVIRNKTINLGRFYWKRSLRIFPPYYIFLGLYAWWAAGFLAQFEPYAVTPELRQQFEMLKATRYDAIIWDLLYLSNYIPGTMTHGWSLSLEEQFYLFLPAFLLLVFRYVPERRRLLSLIILYCLPVIYRLWYFYAHMQDLPPEIDANNPAMVQFYMKETYLKQLYYPFHARIDAIFTGIIAAYIYDYEPQWITYITETTWVRRTLHGGSWLAIVLISFLVNEFDGGVFGYVLRFNALDIAWMIIMIMAIRPVGTGTTLLARALSWWPFSPVAKLSYCAYIIHGVVGAWLIGEVFQPNPLTGQPAYPITMAHIFLWWLPFSFVTLFAAYWFHLIAERPFMLIRSWLGKRSQMHQVPGKP